MTFSVTRTGGSLRPNLRVLRNVVPNGAPYGATFPVIASDTNSSSGSNTLNFISPFTGTATFEVSNWNGDTGPYRMTLRSTGGGSPRLAISPTTLDFGNVRVGTSSGRSLAARNVGTATLNGNFNSPVGSGDFSGPTSNGAFSLSPGQSTSRGYIYTPGQRGGDSGAITVSSNGGNQTARVLGRGVGPVYSSTPGTPPPNNSSAATMIQFDDVDTVLGPDETSRTLTIRNITSDGNLGSLTALSLLSASIGGADADQFDIDFTPTTLLPGQSASFNMTFSSDLGPNGLRTALLRIVTDQGAAFRQVGDSFYYQLKGIQTPEPGSILLWSMIGAGAFMLRRRRNEALAA